MGRILDLYRQRFPQDSRSDSELTIWLGQERPDLRTDAEFDREFRRSIVSKREAFGEDTGVVSEFTGGFKRGLEGLKTTAIGAAALAADKVGADGIADTLLEKARGSGRPEAAFDYRAAEGVGETALATAAAAGESLPSLIESIATGLIGSAIGTGAAPGAGTVAGAGAGLVGKTAVKQTIKRGVRTALEARAKKALAKQGITEIAEEAMQAAVVNEAKKVAGLGVLTLNSVGLNAGGLYSGLRESGVDRETAGNIALGSGLVAGGLDAITPGSVLSKSAFFRNAKTDAEKEASAGLVAKLMDNFWARAVKEGATASSTEAGTEFLQELISIAAERRAKAQEDVGFLEALRSAPVDAVNTLTDLSDEDFLRLRRAAELGAVGGALVGPVAAIGGGTENVTPPDAQEETTPPSPEDPVSPKQSDDIAPALTTLTKGEEDLVSRAVELSLIDRNEISADDEIEQNELLARLTTDPVLRREYLSRTKLAARAGKKLAKPSTEAKAASEKEKAASPEIQKIAEKLEEGRAEVAEFIESGEAKESLLDFARAMGVSGLETEIEGGDVTTPVDAAVAAGNPRRGVPVDTSLGLEQGVEDEEGVETPVDDVIYGALKRDTPLSAENLEALDRFRLAAVSDATPEPEVAPTPQQAPAASTATTIPMNAVHTSLLDRSHPDAEDVLSVINSITGTAWDDTHEIPDKWPSHVIRKETFTPDQLSKTQAFQGTDPNRVLSMSKADQTGSIVLFRDKGKLSVVDGNHRRAAAIKADRPASVIVFEKTDGQGSIRLEGFDSIVKEDAPAPVVETPAPPAPKPLPPIVEIETVELDNNTLQDQLNIAEQGDTSKAYEAVEVTDLRKASDSVEDFEKNVIRKGKTNKSFLTRLGFPGHKARAAGIKDIKRSIEAYKAEKKKHLELTEEIGSIEERIKQLREKGRNPENIKALQSSLNDIKKAAKRAKSKIEPGGELSAFVIGSPDPTFTAVATITDEGVFVQATGNHTKVLKPDTSSGQLAAAIRYGSDIRLAEEEETDPATGRPVLLTKDVGGGLGWASWDNDAKFQGHNSLTSSEINGEKKKVSSRVAIFQNRKGEGFAGTAFETTTDGQTEMKFTAPPELVSQVKKARKRLTEADLKKLGYDGVSTVLLDGISSDLAVKMTAPEIDSIFVPGGIADLRQRNAMQSLELGTVETDNDPSSSGSKAARARLEDEASAAVQLTETGFADEGQESEINTVIDDKDDSGEMTPEEEEEILALTQESAGSLLERATLFVEHFIDPMYFLNDKFREGYVFKPVVNAKRLLKQEKRRPKAGGLKFYQQVVIAGHQIHSGSGAPSLDELGQHITTIIDDTYEAASENWTEDTELPDIQRLYAEALTEELGLEEDGDVEGNRERDGRESPDQNTPSASGPQVTGLAVAAHVRRQFEDSYNEETGFYEAMPEKDGVGSLLQDLPATAVFRLLEYAGADPDALFKDPPDIEIDGKKPDFNAKSGETWKDYQHRTLISLDSFSIPDGTPEPGQVPRYIDATDLIYKAIGYDYVEAELHEIPDLKFRSEEDAIRGDRFSSDHADSRLAAAMVNLQHSGIEVGSSDLLGDGQLGAFLEIPNGKRLIALAASEISNPSSDTLVTVYHEAGHAVFSDETPERRISLQRAIAEMHDITEDTEEDLVERVANKLVEEGFDPGEAVGLMQRLSEFVRDLYVRVGMWLQEKINNGPVSESLAEEYFSYRVKKLLRGDRATISFKDWIGMPVSEQEAYTGVASVEGEGPISSYFDPETNSWVHPTVLIDTTLKAKFRSHKTKDKVLPSADTSGAENRVFVAANNAVLDALQDTFNEWDASGNNTEGVPFEVFVGTLKTSNPVEVIKSINDNLAQTGRAEIDPSLRLGGLNENEVKLAANMAHQQLYGLQSRINKIIAKQGTDIKRATNSLNRVIKRLSGLNRQYADADALAKEMQVELSDTVNEYKDSLVGVASEGKRVGSTRAVVAEINKELNRKPVPANNKAMAITIEKAWQKWAKSPDKFFDLVREATDLPLNFAPPKRGGNTVPEIRAAFRASGRSTLVNLAGENGEFALLVGYLRKESVVVDYLSLRKGKADERVEANKALRMAMNRSRDEMDDAMKIARKLPGVGKRLGRLLQRISEAKRSQRKLERDVVAQREALILAQMAEPHITNKQRESERILDGSTLRWEAHHGAKYRVPFQDKKDGKVKWKTKEVNLRSLEVGDLEGLESDLKALSDWLATVPESERGVSYANTLNIFNKLDQIKATRTHSAIRRIAGQKIFGSFTDRLRQIGTPLAKLAAQRIRIYDAETSANLNTFESRGVKWSTAVARAMSAAGWKMNDYRHFIAQVYEPALEYISRREDLLSVSGNEDEVAKVAITEMKRFLHTLPVWPKIRNASDELTKVFWITYQSSKAERDLAAKYDLKVLDEGTGLKYNLYRSHIGHPLMRVSRTFNSEFAFVKDHLDKLGWKDAPMSTDKVKAVIQEGGAEALQAHIAKHLTPEVISEFIEPIIGLSGRAAFSNPYETARASTENVRLAWEQSGKNIVTFANRLYEMETGVPTPPEESFSYLAEVLDTLNEYYNIAENQLKEARSTNNTPSTESPTVGQYMLHSREANEMPSEWMSYSKFDRHTASQHMRQFVHHYAFGATGTGFTSQNPLIFKLIDQVIEEQKDLAGEYRNLLDREGLTPKQVKAKVGVDQQIVLRQAARNLADVAALKSQLVGYMESHLHRDVEVNAMMEVLGAMAGTTVQGPGTPLIDTISTAEQAMRRLGLSRDAFQFVKTAGKSAAGEMARTLLAAVGFKIQIRAKNHRRRFENGFFDSDSKLGLRDNVRAELLRPIDIRNPVGKAIVGGARVVRGVLQSGVLGKSEAAVTFKPHAAFTQVAQWINHANIDAVWDSYDNLLMLGMKFLNENPDLDKPGVNLERNERFRKMAKADSNLIFDNAKAFEFKWEAAKDLGLDMNEIIVREHRKAKSKIQSEGFSPVELKLLASVAKNEISKDTGLSTRPGWLLSSTAGAVANPLLGWSLSKTFEIPKGLRAADLKKTRQALGLGLKAYAGILPLGVAYAILRDEYDEEILGKKGNVIYLPGEFGKMIKGEQHESGLALIDNLTRVGTFGMGGDMLNNLMNADTIRGGEGLGLERRVFLMSSLQSVISATQTLWRQSQGLSPADFAEAYSWETVGRPLFSGLGGSGYLQYWDALENKTHLDFEEGRVARRININNLLRASGRANAIEVRKFGGASISTPAKVHIKGMLLAALANDPKEFEKARNRALEAAKSMGKEDPEDFVKRSFQGVHPLRNLFKHVISPAEVEKVISSMSQDSQRAVREGIHLINQYGSQIGVPAYFGSAPRKSKKSRDRAAFYRAASGF